MAKTKISEFNANPALNTDIDSINISEGCAPSGINDAIRELMAQLKDFQTGAVGDSFNGPIGTTTAAAGAFTTLTTTSTINGLTVGKGAGAVATNTAVGASALAANTSGANNTAMGYSALATNSTGSGVTAFGSLSLNLSTGNDNTAFGFYSMSNNSTGINNTGIGRGALFYNTTGGANKVPTVDNDIQRMNALVPAGAIVQAQIVDVGAGNVLSATIIYEPAVLMRGGFRRRGRF